MVQAEEAREDGWLRCVCGLIVIICWDIWRRKILRLYGDGRLMG